MTGQPMTDGVLAARLDALRSASEAVRAELERAQPGRLDIDTISVTVTISNPRVMELETWTSGTAGEMVASLLRTAVEVMRHAGAPASEMAPLGKVHDIVRAMQDATYAAQRVQVN